jgi:hypothetical protein
VGHALLQIFSGVPSWPRQARGKTTAGGPANADHRGRRSAAGLFSKVTARYFAATSEVTARYLAVNSEIIVFIIPAAAGHMTDAAGVSRGPGWIQR